MDASITPPAAAPSTVSRSRVSLGLRSVCTTMTPSSPAIMSGGLMPQGARHAIVKPPVAAVHAAAVPVVISAIFHFSLHDSSLGVEEGSGRVAWVRVVRRERCIGLVRKSTNSTITQTSRMRGRGSVLFTRAAAEDHGIDLPDDLIAAGAGPAVQAHAAGDA